MRSYAGEPLRIKLIDLAGIVGGLFITYYGVGYLMEKIPLRLRTPDMSPPEPRALPAGSPPPPAKPVLMTGELRLTPGRRYGVALDTPGVIPSSIIRSRAPDLAREMGFTNVDVFTEGPPAGWPGMKKGKSDADAWIVAFYSGEPKTLPRSKSGVDVIEAWEG